MSSKLNLGIRCYAYIHGDAIWGMLTELKADMVLFAGNTVIRIWALWATILAVCGATTVT